MAEFAKEILPINIEEEMKQSYLDYAMSVIVGRALPDVRDGLKPVHRRVLFAMSELGNDYNKPYKKSARVVGDTIGKYHPHGDTAVYDALVRMAQDFSMSVPMIDGQGNFGSVDGDAPAAMRYTEVRMTKLAHELLADIDKNTVDFVENYDGSEREPAVFPTRVPNLLINGSSGIAVGMATNVPPHKLEEVIDACIAEVEDPDIDIAGLMQHIKGPDFPTGGIINGARGIYEAYHSGRGRIYVRARAEREAATNGDRERIVVTELPYQVNKARLTEKMADLVREKRLEGIAALRDESDKDGMRLVIELRRDADYDIVLNNLYQQTQMQTVFGINLVALVDGQPRLLNLKQLVQAFVRHRREVVTRRTLFDLDKARNRAHVLEGQAVALANIDPIIALIKASPTPAEAREGLMARTWAPGVVSALLERAGAEETRPAQMEAGRGLVDGGYRLSEVQAQAILDLRLNRLTGLEQEKIVKEFEDILERIAELLDILRDPERLRAVIKGELEDLHKEFGTPKQRHDGATEAYVRRTEIRTDHSDLNIADLITPEDVVVTLSNGGYVKWQSLDLYAAQRRGGRGKTATTTKQEDFVETLLVANTHDTILCFSSRGKVYWLRVFELPQASRTARGRPIVNLLPLEEGERINAILPLSDFQKHGAAGEGEGAQGYVFMATASGVVKKTPLSDFSRPRSTGIIAIDLLDDDQLVGVALTDGERDVMLACSSGKSIRFNERDVRAMGRTARGVRGMRFAAGERIISLIIVESGMILTVTENGYGKCTPAEDYRGQGRGGQGLISIRTTTRNGPVVGALLVHRSDEIMLITDGGTLVRTRVDEISVLGRNTQGVTLMRLSEGERLVGLQRIEDPGNGSPVNAAIIEDDDSAVGLAESDDDGFHAPDIGPDSAPDDGAGGAEDDDLPDPS
ncbi:MAG: DNA gyrase subunit A [Gammaproteobacteria bacterium]